jgi:CDP-diacylglycerol--glycerol-3-phosphate 3-phosphatidyltransferase
MTMTFNLPNTLTLIRIVVIPLIVIVFFLPVPWARPAAALLFALAGITDYFDGYLAPSYAFFVYGCSG